MFKILPFCGYDKEIELDLDGILVKVDYDDVDHKMAEKLARKIVKLLKEDAKK